jgi:hypothetical protein
MTTASTIASKTKTAAVTPPTPEELMERLGGIPTSRILVQPGFTLRHADLFAELDRHG